MVGRFTLALQMTLDSGMSAHRALRLSLQATGNAAYESTSPQIEKEPRSGETLTRSLAGAKILPAGFIQTLAIAEDSGRVPEVMRKLCRDYNNEAGRRLAALSQVAAWGVWLVYAIFMIVMIIQLFQIYLGYLNAGVTVSRRAYGPPNGSLL
jgi:type II secretory pathway component PulF